MPKEKEKSTKDQKRVSKPESQPESLDEEISEVVPENAEKKETSPSLQEPSLTAELKALKQRRSEAARVLAPTVIISLVAGLASGVFGSLYLGPWLKKNVVGQNDSVATEIRKVVLDEDSAIVEVVKAANPAVVSIIVSKDLPKLREFFFSPFGDEDFFFSPFGFEAPTDELERQRIGAGTGFIVTKDGLIITNKHVVSDEQAEYTVITNDGSEYPGRVVAKDPLNDLAVVKIEADSLPTIPFGNSDEVVLGQRVVAIGNALGEFKNTVTTGVISGIGRTVAASDQVGRVEQLQEVIQTDAAINPGNSGGPLLNLAGQVIGVNTAIDRSGQLVGFAIPANEAKKALDDVRQHGKVLRPFIGIRYILVDEAYSKENSLPAPYGALILRGDEPGEAAVLPGSPADKAGLKENDIILEINGKKIDRGNPLGKILKGLKPGDQVVLKIQRGPETKEVLLTLGEA